MTSSLGHLPGVRWRFDEEVAICFDDMLQRSIPLYWEMRQLVTRLAKRYAQPQTLIVDMGASLGGAISELVKDPELGENLFEAWEVAPAMLAELRARWPEDEPRVRVVDVDLREPFLTGASVMLSVLTLQFTPIEHRQRIVRDVWRSLCPGGAFILVEKVLGASADIDAALVEEYHADKRAVGYSQEEIDRKRLALEGVLVPVTYDWNVQILKSAGFHQVDSFWRCLNFAGFIAIK